MEKGNMIVFHRYNGGVYFHITGRKIEYKRTNNFYISDEEFKELNNKDIIAKDIYNYCDLWRRENKLYFDATFLDTVTGNKIIGRKYSFIINYNEFAKWYKGKEENLRLAVLPISDRKIPYIHYVEGAKNNFKNIMKDKFLRKKLSKALTRLSAWDAEEIRLFDDWNEDSLYFEEWNNNKRVMNGGITFHKDNKNYSKSYYGIHT